MQIRSINFDQCELIKSSAVLSIAENCPNLLRLSLQWCLQVEDEAVEQVILKCRKLKKLDCTGMKKLRDCLLKPLIAEGQGVPTALRSLKILSFHRCDYISNQVLEACYSKFGMCIHDFYNELIE
jgi:hypothetical protein